MSSTDQVAGNQTAELRALAANRGLTITAGRFTEYIAYQNGNGKGAKFDAGRKALLEGARLGQYGTVVVWALDRRCGQA